jgi:hypothetical protein
MNSEVNKGVFIAIIAVVVVGVVFLGYRVIFPGKATVPDATRQKYMQRMNSGPTSYSRTNTSGPAPTGQ